MKKIAALLTAALLAGAGCKKVDELTEFDLTYSSNQELPGSGIPVGGTADFVTPDIETNTQSQFAANSTRSDLIESIKLTRFAVTNESGHLDFLRSFTVYIAADGLGENEIARKSQIPDGVSTVEADLTGVNVKEYLLKSHMNFRLRVSVDSLPSENQQLKLDQTMRVSGKKLSKK